MQLVSVPEFVKASRPDCRIVSMGPPRGVSHDEVGTAEMLISGVAEDIPNYPARRQYAYFKPSATELELLAAGAVIEFCQYGTVVQPFSAEIFPAPTTSNEGTPQ